MLSESDAVSLETMTSSADACHVTADVVGLTGEQVPALQNGVFVISPEVHVCVCVRSVALFAII